MKIIIDKDIPFIEGRFPDDIEVKYLPGHTISRTDVADADALIVRTRTKCGESLLKGSSVKLVATATIGTDHIDTDWCSRNGIIIKNAPGCNAPGVAQYLFASLFSQGFDPKKDTLGIVGNGNVGGLVAEWASNMGIRTLLNDPPKEVQEKNETEYVDLEEVLREADAVSFHVPFTRCGKFPTYHLAGYKELEMMKLGSLLVNTSRGGVVDEEALKNQLKSGRLRAIIDVWENEPAIDPELASLASIATPHIAGYSAEGKKRATRMALIALDEVLGVKVDLKGLETDCLGNDKISKKLIEASYNPLLDHEIFIKDLSGFETLRNRYNYRHEPLFLK